MSPQFPAGTPLSDTVVQRGWRIERIPGRPVHSLEDGRFGLPLWLLKDGKHIADLELSMSPAETERVHADFCRALGLTDPTVPHTSDCRCAPTRGGAAW